MKTKLLILFLSFLLIACEKRLDTEVAIKHATGKTYTLVAPYKDYGITINIHENKINGFAGVNSYNGSFEIINGSIRIYNISRTKMAGQDKVMKAEEDYIKNLEAASKISVYKNDLRIGNMKFIEKK